jgi:hydrogenase nickel incorporation protein HypA/HybF
MHELSLCQAIADTAQQRAAGRPVRQVNVRIGHLRQVVPDSLTFAWDLLIEGTDLAGSTLEVDHVPAVVVCGGCGESTTLEWPVLACGQCASHDVQLISGDELLLVSLELAPSPGRVSG